MVAKKCEPGCTCGKHTRTAFSRCPPGCTCQKHGNPKMGRPVKTESTNYSTLHKRVVKVRGPAKNQPCEHCDNQAAEWALTHGKTGQDPNDFVPLCRKCHQKYDNHAGYKRGKTHEDLFGPTTFEQRSDRVKKGWAGMTAEARAERVRKAHEARWGVKS